MLRDCINFLFLMFNILFFWIAISGQEIIHIYPIDTP